MSGMIILMALAGSHILAQPFPNSGDHSVCQGATEPYGVVNTPGSSYAWQITPITTGNGTIVGMGNIINVIWTNVGTCTLRVTETNSLGCAGPPVTILITVHPIPNVLATPSSLIICSPGTTGISLTSVVPGTTFTWTVTESPLGSISGFAAGNGNLIAQTLSNTTPSPATVTYTITPEANGCVGLPINVVVTVNPTPIAVATPALQTLCSNGTTAIGLSSTAAATTYTWTSAVTPPGSVTGASAGTGNLISQVLLNATAGSGVVTYTISSIANGCSGIPISAVVTVNPRPIPMITGLTPVCLNTTGSMYTTGTGMTNYNWNVVGGIITAGIGTNNIEVTWNTAGPGSVSVTYTDANGCNPAVPTSFPVLVHPLPLPTITGPAPVCVNSTANIYITETGMTSYLWVLTGGTITAGNITNAITVTWDVAGNQSVNVLCTDPNGCVPTSPTVYPVLVNPIPVTNGIFHN